MIYNETIRIPESEARGMQSLLDANKPPPQDGVYNEHAKIYEVNCGENYLVHVNILVEKNGPVVDAALFFRRRRRSWEEVDSVHRRILLGDYQFLHDGNIFLISVVEVPDQPPSSQKKGRKRSN